jgi:hypothetical protein
VERRGRRHARLAARILGLAAAALLAGHGAHAASVRSLSVSEMLAGAELVFEGRAVGRRTAEDGGPGGLRTCVRFEVLEVLKGPAVSSPLELCFAGGRSRYGVSRSVMGLDRPMLGERGIYFVGSLADPYLVHPLVGWDQGRFKVAADETVTTSAGDPVLGVDADAGAANGAQVARGARVGKRGARSGAAPMDAAAFKARLRELLAEGR